MAAAVHAQLDDPMGPLDIHRIARVLDIAEIRVESLVNLEGALITTPERGYGSILVNAHSSPQRQRFTIAHELCHFLHPDHRPVPGVGFECTASDIRYTPRLSTRGNQRHIHQEREANRFAIELLLPDLAIATYADRPPDLSHVLQISAACDVSREAAARRYAEQHIAQIAIVFSHEARVRYAVRSQGMPALRLTAGSPLPPLSPAGASRGLTLWQNAPASPWLAQPERAAVSVQILFQQSNFAMTLVWVQ